MAELLRLDTPWPSVLKSRRRRLAGNAGFYLRLFVIFAEEGRGVYRVDPRSHDKSKTAVTVL